MDESLLWFALLQPADARPLRVIVRQQRTITLAREITRKICGYRRFTRTTLRVQDENSLHVGFRLRSPRHRGKGVTRCTERARGFAYTQGRMEWILQVVDEIDDAVSALRLCSLGLSAEVGLAVAGAFGVGAIGVALVANLPP